MCRQVFNAYPYVLPEEDPAIISIYKQFGTLRKIKKGEVLKSGGQSQKLYFIEKGLCCYIINYLLDKPRALALALANRAVGDITCISGEKVNVTITALRNSEIYVVPPDILINKMKQSYEISEKITKMIIAKQECHIEGMIANFTLEHEERLITFYKVLILSYSGLTNDLWQKLPIRLSNEELGMIIHGTRVTVNRIHLKWQENNLFKKADKEVYINSDLFKSLYDWHD